MFTVAFSQFNPVCSRCHLRDRRDLGRKSETKNTKIPSQLYSWATITGGLTDNDFRNWKDTKPYRYRCFMLEHFKNASDCSVSLLAMLTRNSCCRFAIKQQIFVLNVTIQYREVEIEPLRFYTSSPCFVFFELGLLMLLAGSGMPSCLLFCS